MSKPKCSIVWTNKKRVYDLSPQQVSHDTKNKVCFVRISYDGVKWIFGHLFSKSKNIYVVVLLGSELSIRSPFWNLPNIKDRDALELGKLLIDRSHNTSRSPSFKIHIQKSRGIFVDNNQNRIHIEFAIFTSIDHRVHA